MKGTASIEVSQLYRGIIDYFVSIPEEEITPEQAANRDRFLSEGAIICDDKLDDQLIKLQQEYAAEADDLPSQAATIEKAILLLS